MKKLILALVLGCCTAGLAAYTTDVDARRLGGGGSIGKQRTTPPTAPQQATSAPTQATQAAQAPAAAAAAKPGFMSKYGGLLAGLGVGALLASMFGSGLGSFIGSILIMLLIAGVVFFIFRMIASRNAPRQQGAANVGQGTAGMQFAGAGADVPPNDPSPFPMAGSFGGGSRVAPEPAAAAPLQANDPETAALLRLAQSAFIRLQAANDARDLDDIRSATTPEMYAELAMQIRERGDAPQRTDVLSLDAQLVEMTVEGDHGIFSVRYSGMIRETAGAEPQPFSEIWHLRKNLKDPQSTWLIAGIQQA